MEVSALQAVFRAYVTKLPTHETAVKRHRTLSIFCFSPLKKLVRITFLLRFQGSEPLPVLQKAWMACCAAFGGATVAHTDL